MKTMSLCLVYLFLASGVRADKAGGYPTAYNRLGERIMAAHSGQNWIVDKYDAATPDANRVLVVQVLDRPHPKEFYRRVGAELYQRFLATRRQFLKPADAQNAWVLVIDDDGKQSVRADHNGAHAIH